MSPNLAHPVDVAAPHHLLRAQPSAGHRGTRLCYDLLGAAVEHARSSGARALEGYPMITQPGEDITWGETHVGTRSMFTALGFDEVGHPTKRRVVMRMDF